MSMRTFALGNLILVCLAGCAAKTPPAQPVARTGGETGPGAATPVSAAPAAEPVPAFSIGSFKGRDHTVTIESAADGPRFTVKTNDGQVLGTRLTAEELQAKLPEVYESFKSSIAGSGHLDASARMTQEAGRSSHIDASIDAAR
jgi:hypothetical protein